MNDIEKKWFDFKWFDYELLVNEYEYVSPEFIYLAVAALIAIPSLFFLRFLLGTFFGKKLDVAMLEKNIRRFNLSAILQIIPSMLMSLFVALVLFALSRPQKTEEHPPERWSEGIDISLIIDISNSMQLMDFKPNRLEKVKKVAQNFVENRIQDRIGVVIFRGQAFPQAPLTTDYSYVKQEIKDIDFEIIREEGTAIGNAIQCGMKQLKDSEAKSKVMILLSDGENTAGNLDPIDAAMKAHAFDIKIYSIGIGKEGQVLAGEDKYRDFFGRIHTRPRYVQSSLDETALRQIAKIGEGQFFRANDSNGLKKIFETIDEMEKSEILEQRFKSTTDFYQIYLIWALIPFFLWLLLKSTFITNALLD